MTATVVARVMLAVGFVAMLATVVWRWRDAGRDDGPDRDTP